jgi:peptidoglycan L-alanyl-D-glutamate endopeptidase CwlK
VAESHVETWQRAIGFTGTGIDGDFGPGTLARSIAVLRESSPEQADPEPPPADPIKWPPSMRSDNLRGVHPVLCHVLSYACNTLGLSDVLVLEGLRTPERQATLVASGASRTLNSRHLTGHAIDLAPRKPDGNPSWVWEDYFRVAETMRMAAVATRTPLTWGGVWDRDVRDLTDLRAAVNAYVKRYKSANPGKAPLLDGPHWELPKSQFPQQV